MGNIRSNREFIEKICADTWKELYRFVYYKVQNREEAEDITQETYARAISFMDRNNAHILEFNNYLKAISMNIIKDQWRAKKRRAVNVNLEEVNPEEIALEDFSDSVSDKALIEEAMKCLTEEQQTVINLRIIEGYTVSETAKLMKKKEGAIRTLQFRAVKSLTKRLEELQDKED